MVFPVGILQDPVGCCEKYQKVPDCTATVCVNIEASTRPINFPTLLRHTLCYLLEEYLKRNSKGWVPVENIEL